MNMHNFCTADQTRWVEAVRECVCVCVCMCLCVYVHFLRKTSWRSWKYYGIISQTKILRYILMGLWALKKNIFLFHLFILTIIFKKTKAYSGSPRRQEGILFCNFSFHICIWIYDKADSKVINKSYEKRTETYYVNYAFVPREG